MCYSQDTIALRNHDKILAKDIDISKKIYYRYYHDTSSNFRAAEKKDIAYIHWTDGSVQTYHPLEEIKQKDTNKLVVAIKDTNKKDTTRRHLDGTVYVNLGFGEGLISHDINQNYFGGVGPRILTEPVAVNITADYCFDKRISIGACFAYQNLTDNPIKGGIVLNYETEFIQRYNYSIRVIYHPFNLKMKNFYCGVRLGVSVWVDYTVNPTNLTNNPAYITIQNPFDPSFQVFGGYRIIFADLIGLHIEAGIGTPYLIEGGVTVKLNTRKNK